MNKVYRLYVVENNKKRYVHCSEMCNTVEEFIEYYISISDPEDFDDDYDLYMIVEQALHQDFYDVELDSDGETEYVDIVIYV